MLRLMTVLLAVTLGGCIDRLPPDADVVRIGGDAPGTGDADPGDSYLPPAPGGLIVAGGWSEAGNSSTATVFRRDANGGWSPQQPDIGWAAAATLHAGRYVIAGGERTWGVESNVWGSDDGIEWALIGNLPAARAWGSLASFAGALWYLGGYDGSQAQAAIFRSNDGSSWTVAGMLPAPRDGMGMAEHAGALWLLGGHAANAVHGDVWRSSDGANWSSAGALPQAAEGIAAASFDGALWIAGGWTSSSSAPLAQTWSTIDGATWSPGPTLPTALGFGALVQLGSSLVTLGGEADSRAVDEVLSTDGTAAWQLLGRLPRPVEVHSAFADGAGVAVHLGGSSNVTSPLLRTDDGRRWGWQLPIAVSEMGYAEHAGRLWILGGYASYHSSPAILVDTAMSSLDGQRWQLGAALPMTVYGAAAASHAGRLWMVGGEDAGGNWERRAFSSVDGASWSAQALLPDDRYGASAVSHNGELFILGGNGVNTEIFAATDGSNWRTAGNLPAPRSSGCAVLRGGRIWYLGGSDGGGSWGMPEVWSSADGSSWTPEVPLPLPRSYQRCLVIGDELWVVGGYYDNAAHDNIWVLSGSTWVTRGALPESRDTPAVFFRPDP